MRSFLLALLIFSFLNSAHPQSFKLGIKAEFFGYQYGEVNANDLQYSEKFYASPLPSLYVFILKEIPGSNEIILRPGFLFLHESSYSFFELGLQFNHHLWDTKFYLSGGLNTHFVSSDNHGAGTTDVTFSKTLFFWVLGLGYKFAEHISADISFHQPFDGRYGYTSTAVPVGEPVKGDKKIGSMVKLGIGLGF